MWLLYSNNNSDGCRAVLNQINDIGCSTPGVVICSGTGYEDLPLPEGWEVNILEKHIGLCATMNLCFNQYPNEPWYGLIIDDEFVYTPEWDKKLVMAAGKTRVAHGNDHTHSLDSLSTYIVFGGDLIRAVGWWALPGLWHWYLDQVWKNFVMDLPLRRFVPEVKTDRKPKAEVINPDAWKCDFDHQEYLKWFTYTYPELLRKVEKDIKT